MLNFNQIKSLYEKELTSNEIDMDKAYDIWKKTYDEAIGSSWPKDKFLHKARNWTFFGDENGYIAVRKQKSGLVKLVGMAGNSISILKGFNELESHNYPVWGVVTENIIKMLNKKGFIPASSDLIKLSTSSGLIDIEMISPGITVNSDGSFSANGLTKHFIGNKKYYEKLLNYLMIKQDIDNDTKKQISDEIKKILEEAGQKSTFLSRIKSAL